MNELSTASQSGLASSMRTASWSPSRNASPTSVDATVVASSTTEEVDDAELSVATLGSSSPHPATTTDAMTTSTSHPPPEPLATRKYCPTWAVVVDGQV